MANENLKNQQTDSNSTDLNRDRQRKQQNPNQGGNTGSTGKQGNSEQNRSTMNEDDNDM